MDIIEQFINANVTSWTIPPNTTKLAGDFEKMLKLKNDKEIGNMINVCGYIPEHYDHDSSQETLHTKLLEVLIATWAVRIGFSKSAYVKQKARVEDVTIDDGKNVLVSDVKSYRLGRSQASPNVKDVVKKGDFPKWGERHASKNVVGGFVSFPSAHMWKEQSDVFQYCSESSFPILLLTYEHMAFCISYGITNVDFVRVMKMYPRIFTKSTKDQKEYFEKIENELFKNKIEDWNSQKSKLFKQTEKFIEWREQQLIEFLDEKKHEIELAANKLPYNQLLIKYINASLSDRYQDQIRQLTNLRKFRLNR